MSDKARRIAAFLEPHRSGPRDPHYAAFFDCFHAGRFFEAHEVLEVLWLRQRESPDGDFYKALIQLAGAFVHFQKDRPGPAGALLKLALTNLERFPDEHHGLDVRQVRQHLRHWLTSGAPASNPVSNGPSASWLPRPR